jgi:hypothetical protein
MSSPKMRAPASHQETEYAQVERVLNSTTFRNCDVLRRLLRFLADTAIAGEADQLKEYTIGIALGKPSTYDPREDSAVRIQVGRLRQKLAEYYKEEGKNDPILIDVPKGQFNIKWEARAIAPSVVSPIEAPAEKPAQIAMPSPARRNSLVPWIVAAVFAVWAIMATVSWLQDRGDAATMRKAWTPELQQLWQPLLESNRPIVVATSSPLFVGFPGNGFFRDQTINNWQDAVNSPRVAAVRKALGNPPIVERYYYSGTGELNALFHLGKLLNFTGHQVTTARSSQISWQQMVDNNVLLIGPPRTFGDQLHKLPVNVDFTMKEDGIHDTKPKAGQPTLYADAYPSMLNAGATEPDDGEVYALVSRMPGPLGAGDIQTFSSNHSPGTLGAIQWFTTPGFARELVKRLRGSDGNLPRYFQLILKVKYRDAVPTEITYVTHRELKIEKSTGSLKD